MFIDDGNILCIDLKITERMVSDGSDEPNKVVVVKHKCEHPIKIVRLY